MDLLQTLRQIARNHSSIRLLNIYKGLPVAYDTNIVSVGISEIQVPGSKNHIACLYYQGEAYLQGAELPVVIRSEVKSLNLAQDFAILANFEIARDNIGKRSQIRVEPDDPLVGTIKFAGSAFEFLTPLSDISANGVGIFFESYLFPTRLAQPGNELTLTISIPDFAARKTKKLLQRQGGDARNMTGPLRANLAKGQDGQIAITASGKVIEVHMDAASNRYRVSVQVFFKDLSRMVILQYIAHRQSEIIQDLQAFSEDLYNSKNK